MSGVRVVASAALSSNFDKRYVVVDEATGEIVDDAQGCGYKSAQNAHRAHAYKSMPPKKKRQRDAAKRQVQRWCAQHPQFIQHVGQSMFYAMKDDQNVTEAGVSAILAEHGLELPFSVKDLMRHWNGDEAWVDRCGASVSRWSLPRRPVFGFAPGYT